MTPITEHGRAHLAQVEAERAERLAARQAAPLDDLDVGCVAFWDRAPNGDADTLRSGMVVDVGDKFVVVLDSALNQQEFVVEVRRRGGRHASTRMLVRARRIAVESLTSAEPRTARAQVEYARACFLSAGLSAGEWDEVADELLRYGWALLDVARGRAA